MFELNLIKDKAKARQRRRVIFMAIMCIMLLTGLVGIVVGMQAWRESIELDKAIAEVKRLTDTNASRKADLDSREPKVLKMRNGMVDALLETSLVRKDRKLFTEAMRELYQKKPSDRDFWYHSLEFAVIRSGDANAPANPMDLLGKRSLFGRGYVEITDSDVLTQRRLESIGIGVGGDPRGMNDLVGKPTFQLQLEGEVAGGRGAEDTRYVTFSVQAAQRVFAPGGGE